jgi:hypothetical protein
MRRYLADHWFALALAALVVAGLPSLFLFGLSLFGYEGDANRWLEERWGLGYHLPLPWAVAMLLFLVPFALVLLYFLKLKRKALQVPSTFLWRKSIEDLHVNSLFQWLRQNVLLLLQLLTILSILYAILAPRFHGRSGSGKHYILMIDNSASMSATDVEPNRLESAKAEAIKEIDAAGDDDYGMVLVFNSSAEIRQSYTNNRHVLRQVVRDVQPTQRVTRIEEALALADSLANPTRSTENEASKPADPEPGKERTYVQNDAGVQTEVHLFSDGRFPDAPNFSLGNLDVRLHAIGKAGPENVDNVALVSFNAVRDENDPTHLQVFGRALNFRSRPVRTKLQLEVLVDGRLQKVYEKSLEMPGRRVAAGPPPAEGQPAVVRDEPGEATAIFEITDFDDRAEVVLHGKLLDLRDAFPLDDEAWLVVGVVRKARVLIVTPGNAVLTAFFNDEATQVVADVSYLVYDGRTNVLADREKYLQPARAGAWDLVVFDRCAPAREDEMPRANTFFIGHPPPPWKPPGSEEAGGKKTEKVDNPAIKGWTGQHGLLRYLTGLHEVGVFEAFRMTDLPPRTPRLMEGDRDLSLLLSLPRGAYTDVVLTFSILNTVGEWNTNWPLLPSFPLFWRNVLYTLGNIRDAAGEENTQPGQVKLLRPESTVTKLTVTAPNGTDSTLERGSRADFAYGATDRVGVYDATWANDGHRRFAVNLLDADESNLEPRTAVKIGSEQVQAGSTRRQPRELWKVAVLAGLALLLLEWYVYNRRVFV